eukprot:m.77358 g.77358  ORF g.77358 m.77358 type:complete len:76 (-) comp25003_c0_seq1:36-263(-)
MIVTASDLPLHQAVTVPTKWGDGFPSRDNHVAIQNDVVVVVRIFDVFELCVVVSLIVLTYFGWGITLQSHLTHRE